MIEFHNYIGNKCSCKDAFKGLLNGKSCSVTIGTHTAYIDRDLTFDDCYKYAIEYKDETYVYYADSVKEALKCAINYITTNYYNECCA